MGLAELVFFFVLFVNIQINIQNNHGEKKAT